MNSIDKALTVKQPWAWAIVLGGKDVENRSRKINYRGPLYIHAGQGYAPEAEAFPAIQEAWPRAARALPAERGHMGPLRKNSLFLDYGQVIGRTIVVGCHHADHCRTEHGDGTVTYCSPWAMADHYHWELDPETSTPIDEPFAAVGKLGLWDLSRPTPGAR